MPLISDDEAVLVVKALLHFDAYLIASRREDGAYKALADRLQRKPPVSEESQTTVKRKKAN
jgi:hypothetical protein